MQVFGKIILTFNYFRKTLHHKTLHEKVLNVSGFKYFRVLNFPGIPTCKGSEFTWFHRVDLFWICQVFAYASITQGSEYAWINYSDYGRAINMSGQSFTAFWMSLVLNMPGLGIWPGFDYAWVAQGCEYAWISMSMP